MEVGGIEFILLNHYYMNMTAFCYFFPTSYIYRLITSLEINVLMQKLLTSVMYILKSYVKITAQEIIGFLRLTSFKIPNSYPSAY